MVATTYNGILIHRDIQKKIHKRIKCVASEQLLLKH